jgi:hypothetical protein
MDMTGDDWVSWSCTCSSSKAEVVVDGSGGSWFCAGRRTRWGEQTVKVRSLDACKEATVS